MFGKGRAWTNGGSRHGHVARGSAVKETLMSNPVISSDKVEGTAVYASNGDKLGSIDDLIIDKRSGQVRYAALEFGGFLGVGTDRYPVPWAMLKYDTNLDGYVVPLDANTLDNAPRYTREEQPDYSDDYGRRVYEHYGVTW
jgi:sporulation protein YlmC with PRC-barrel domain